MERKIVVYGHGDIRPVLGFPDETDFRQWKKENVFHEYEGRYHYTAGKEADVIILSRKGLAYGHFEIEGKTEPTQKDFQDNPETRFVYLVRSSALYGNPVRLSGLGIKNIRFGQSISETTFEEIKKSAGDIQEYHS